MQKPITAFRLSATCLAALLAVFLIPPATNQLSKGRFYSSLADRRPAIDADPAIVLIEVDPGTDFNVRGPAVWTDFFLALGEMGAEQALLLLPDEVFEQSVVPSRDQKEYIIGRFDTEFGLINRNIATLFEAIRFGSVRPQDTAEFIDNLAFLVNKSKERLLDDAMNADSTESLRLEKARVVFGEDRIGKSPSDLGYSFPTYRSSLVIADYPLVNEDTLPFRRLSIELIRDYVQLEDKLYHLLTVMEEAGYFHDTPPESYPTLLYNRAQDSLHALLDTPSHTLKTAWLERKKAYEESVKTLLAGRTETELIQGLDSILAEETLEENQAQRVHELRQTVVESYSETKTLFLAHTALKNLLFEAIRGTCCIVGSSPDPERASQDIWSAPSAAETAAALIHSIRTGRYETIPTGWRQRVLLGIPGILSSVVLSVVSLPWVFALIVISILATGAGFSLLFVNTGIYIHPLHAAVVPLVAGTATLLATWYFRMRWVWATGPGFGSRLPRPLRWALGSVAGPPTGEPVRKRSAILAVRLRSDIGGLEDKNRERRAVLLAEFYGTVSEVIKRRGGAILGVEDFIILAAFGSPIDRKSNRQQAALSDYVSGALAAVHDLAENGMPDTWSFGLDAGECAFYFSSVKGYSIDGPPAVFARILSGLTVRYGHRILATQNVLSEVDREWETKKLDSLAEKASGQEKQFHAFIRRKQA